MSPEPGSRFLWHAIAGLWVGFACTFLIAPISPALRGAGVGGWAALMLVTPVLGVLVGLCCALLPRSTPRALICAFLLALVAGAVDDLAIRAADGSDLGAELAALLALSPERIRPTLLGLGLTAFACALPLCASVWAARSAARQPAGTRGLARNVVLVAGLTASLGVPFVTLGLGAGILWPIASVGCGLGAVACLVQAARDLGVAVWLGRLVRGEDPMLAVARASSEPPMPGLATVASLSDHASTQHVVLRQVRHYDGPNRISQMTEPLVHLGAEPLVVRRSLVRSSVLLLLLAGTQMAMAVAATGLRLPASPLH